MLSAILAAALLFAQAAPATSPTATPAAAQAKPHSDVGEKVSRDNQMLCKTEKVLGSLIPQKVCYTRAQQEDREQQDQKTVQRFQSQFGTHCPPQCR
jgi:invasion protein IalB